MQPTTGDPAVFRILDANLNRAREALRVLEEFARFALNDSSLAHAVKSARHELMASLPPKIEQQLLTARDVAGDPGRERSVPTEWVRRGPHHVAVIGARRLTEALRVLEEYGKSLDEEWAQALKPLRYQGYELERRILLIDRSDRRLENARLYVILTESHCRGDWYETAAAALDGGSDVIQLREKDLSDRRLVDRARKLTELCRSRGALLVVNDRPDIARAAGADGVHLGQEDLTVSDARRFLGHGFLVGLSTHTPGQIERAIADAPDYIAVGPVFPSDLKPESPRVDPSLVAYAVSQTAIPVVAIGGLNFSNADVVIRTRVRCLCVCRAVIAAEDVAEAARRLRGLIDRSVQGVGCDKPLGPSS